MQPDKFERLVTIARQQPERLSPAVRAKLNGHLSAIGEPLLFAPVAESVTTPVQTAAPSTVTAADLASLKREFAAKTAAYTADPATFTSDAHSELYRMKALINFSEAVFQQK